MNFVEEKRYFDKLSMTQKKTRNKTCFGFLSVKNCISCLTNSKYIFSPSQYASLSELLGDCIRIRYHTKHITPLYLRR